MLLSFDIKFIRRDQNQRKNDEACRTISMCIWSSLINLISKDTVMVFYLSCIFSRVYGERGGNKLKAQFCTNLLTSGMH